MTMKTVFFALFSLLFLFLTHVVAVDQIPLSMRADQKDGFTRIVFESTDQALIEQARVFTSYSLIKLSFPRDFLFKVMKKPESIEVTKKGRSLYFTIENLEKVNVVRLSSPSRLVIDAFLRGHKKPYTIKDKKPKDIKIRTYYFALDAGHGGHDFGISGNNYKESTITLSMVKALAIQINKKKKKVLYTRKGDTYLSIDERISVINSHPPELFLSFHLSRANYIALYTSNLSPDTITKEILYNTMYGQLKHRSESKALARALGDALQREFNLEVFHRELPLPLLSSVNAPAVMVELPGVDFIPYNSATVTRLTRTIVRGISAYEQR